MYSRFGLTLVVNHACNLRCTYCYTGEKVSRRLPPTVGRKAIDRGLQSLIRGGQLDLAFFGGEPLIEPEVILELAVYARANAARREIQLALHMTTNAVVDSQAAWSVMMLPEMQLAVSCDGLPAVHDQCRVTAEGRPTSEKVLETIGRLIQNQRDFSAVMVVRPDNLAQLPAGMKFLYECGVRRFNPSLDLWTHWTRADGERLIAAVSHAADFWAERLPDCAVSWFDEKAARLMQAPLTESARCGFGVGEIAVTPQGNLYPCERLIAADEPDNPMRLPGTVFEGDDFWRGEPRHEVSHDACQPCSLKPWCSTVCRCSNYIRTRDTTRPDALLCLWDQACYRETVRTLQARSSVYADEGSIR